MKQKKKRPENPFDGEFIIPGYETSADGREWIDHDDEAHDEFHDWKFVQENVLNLLLGNAIYEGTFSIYGQNRHVKRTYVYHTADETLFIDRFDCRGDFEIHRRRYRVERMTATEFRLYPLNGAENEPEAPPYRMKIERMPES